MMPFRLVVEPEAERDLAEVQRWYDEQHRGLGRQFLKCVEDVFHRVSATPELHAVAYRNIRQALVRRFPYVVCYTLRADSVYVVAVIHSHRDPTEWMSRAR